MRDIPTLFARHDWPYEELEPSVWHSSFAAEDKAVYHLYVRAAGDWVQFAVSPLVAAQGTGDASGGLHALLLRMNQDLRLARLALDADGDVNLLADLPAAGINATSFGQALEVLAFYAGEIGPQLRQGLADPQFPFAFGE
jgi:hypothetical protein